MALSGAPEEWYACAGGSWIPQYRQHTYRTTVIGLPPEFVEFLVEDGVVVGDSSLAVSCRLCLSCMGANACGRRHVHLHACAHVF